MLSLSIPSACNDGAMECLLEVSDPSLKIPADKALWEIRRLLSLGPLADVELQLPRLFLVAADARQFQRADLRHPAVQVHRHRLALDLGRLQRRCQWRQFLDLVLPVLDDRADRIVATHRRAEEAKVNRL